MKTIITYFLLAFSFVANAQDGILDTAFGTNGKMVFPFLSSVVDVKIDQYDRTMILGKNTNGVPVLVCLTPNGSLNLAFDADGIKEISFGNPNETPVSFDILSNGYAVVSSLSPKIAKVSIDGSFDANFGTNGIAVYEGYLLNNQITSVSYDKQNNKIFVVTGRDRQSSGGMFYKINSMGVVETSKEFYFGNGLAPLSTADNDLNGNLYIFGNFNDEKPVSLKFNANGDQDNSYQLITNFSWTWTPRYYLNRNDGSSFILTSKYAKPTILKRNPNGIIDANFGTNGMVTLNYLYDGDTSLKMKVYNGNKIIVTGITTPATGNREVFLTRLNSDGTVDSNFGKNGLSVVSNINDLKSVYLAISSESGKIYTLGLSTNNTVAMYRFNLPSAILTTNNTNIYKSKIFPNPTKSTLNFSQELSEIKITDMSGKLVSQKKDKTKNISVENLQKGNYIIIAKDNNGKTISEKFIKD